MVNRAWILAPAADLLYACDGAWWRSAEAPQPAEFAGLRVTQDVAAAAADPLLHQVPSEPGAGLSAEPSRIRQNRNGGAQAINLALHLGAARVILLGFDMQAGPAGESHWHGDHGGGLSNPSEALMAGWRQSMAAVARDAAALGLEILNASRRSALDCFPRVALEAL